MSDQEQISNLLLNGDYDWGKDIQIDYYASVFLNMHMADDYGRCYPEQDVTFEDGRLINKHTKYVPSMYVLVMLLTFPCAQGFHTPCLTCLPGTGITLMEAVSGAWGTQNRQCGTSNAAQSVKPSRWMTFLVPRFGSLTKTCGLALWRCRTCVQITVAGR